MKKKNKKNHTFPIEVTADKVNYTYNLLVVYQCW